MFIIQSKLIKINYLESGVSSESDHESKCDENSGSENTTLSPPYVVPSIALTNSHNGQNTMVK